MSPELLGLLSVFAVIALIYGGLNVAVALGAVSFVGVWVLRGDIDRAFAVLAQSATGALDEYLFAVIPLFVLMGLLVSQAGLGRDAFDVAGRIFGRVRGGLGLATVWANALFASITGVSIASAAVFTRVAVPEMIRHGYTPRFAVGVVAGSSVLGMMIPPSLLLILYGIIAEQSIGALFLAGLLPGLFLATVFCLLILGLAVLRPDAVARAAPAVVSRLSPATFAAKLSPIAALALLVLGGIYGGLFTPTEAGAVGAAGALVVALLRRRLDRLGMWTVLCDAGAITVTICLVILAASLYGRMLALSGLPTSAGQWLIARDVPFWTILVLYLATIIAMGFILDSASILLIMVPLILPALSPYGVDLIWFGIVTVLAVEIGLITPPFGLSVFVIKGALPGSDISLGDIFVGAAPFALAMMFALVVLVLVPEISLVLVR